MTTVGVCIRVKNEDLLLKEFVVHYINLGFDKIHIYDNDSSNSVSVLLQTLIEKYNEIITVEMDHSKVGDPAWGQTNRYNDFFNKNKNLTWILNCDADEFLYLHNHDNIKDFLNTFRDDTAVVPVNWVMHGTSNLKQFDKSKLAMEQFVMREEYGCFFNYFVKSFIRPKYISKIVNWHFHDSENNLTQNVYGEIVDKSSVEKFESCEKRRSQLNDETPCVLIHYMTLDFEHMLEKHERNKGTLISLTDPKYTMEWYFKYFKDDIVDYRMKKYVQGIKCILNSE